MILFAYRHGLEQRGLQPASGTKSEPTKAGAYAQSQASHALEFTRSTVTGSEPCAGSAREP